MVTRYKSSSVYGNTKIRSWYLDTWEAKTITPSVNDKPYVIPADYNFRPDLAAYALYGDVNYWYVFCLRNKDKIKDPIFDFKAGLVIYIPQKSSLES